MNWGGWLTQSTASEVPHAHSHTQQQQGSCYYNKEAEAFRHCCQPQPHSHPSPQPKKGVLARLHPEPYSHWYLTKLVLPSCEQTQTSTVTHFNCTVPYLMSDSQLTITVLSQACKVSTLPWITDTLPEKDGKPGQLQRVLTWQAAAAVHLRSLFIPFESLPPAHSGNQGADHSAPRAKCPKPLCWRNIKCPEFSGGPN